MWRAVWLASGRFWILPAITPKSGRPSAIRLTTIRCTCKHWPRLKLNLTRVPVEFLTCLSWKRQWINLLAGFRQFERSLLIDALCFVLCWSKLECIFIFSPRASQNNFEVRKECCIGCHSWDPLIDPLTLLRLSGFPFSVKKFLFRNHSSVFP